MPFDYREAESKSVEESWVSTSQGRKCLIVAFVLSLALVYLGWRRYDGGGTPIQTSQEGNRTNYGKIDR